MTIEEAARELHILEGRFQLNPLLLEGAREEFLAEVRHCINQANKDITILLSQKKSSPETP